MHLVCIPIDINTGRGRSDVSWFDMITSIIIELKERGHGDCHWFQSKKQEELTDKERFLTRIVCYEEGSPIFFDVYRVMYVEDELEICEDLSSMNMGAD